MPEFGITLPLWKLDDNRTTSTMKVARLERGGREEGMPLILFL